MQKIIKIGQCFTDRAIQKIKVLGFLDMVYNIGESLMFRTPVADTRRGAPY